MDPVDLGELRFVLARTVVHDDRRRALELASEARADYARDGVTTEVGRIDAWLLRQVSG